MCETRDTYSFNSLKWLYGLAPWHGPYYPCPQYPTLSRPHAPQQSIIDRRDNLFKFRNFIPENIMAACVQKTSTLKVVREISNASNATSCEY